MVREGRGGEVGGRGMMESVEEGGGSEGAHGEHAMEELSVESGVGAGVKGGRWEWSGVESGVEEWVEESGREGAGMVECGRDVGGLRGEGDVGRGVLLELGESVGGGGVVGASRSFLPAGLALVVVVVFVADVVVSAAEPSLSVGSGQDGVSFLHRHQTSATMPSVCGLSLNMARPCCDSLFLSLPSAGVPKAFSEGIVVDLELRNL